MNKENKTHACYSVCIVIALAASACLVCAMSDGIRNNYGIMLGAIIENSGLTYASVSLVLAAGQLFFGMIQPLFGIIAQKKGNTFALLSGVFMTLAGLLLLPHCKSALPLLFCLGFLLPAGTGATSYGILIGSITPKIPAETVSLVSGFVNASSGVGNAVLSPLLQTLLQKGGISAAMSVLCVPTVLMIPVCLFVGRSGKKSDEKDKSAQPQRASELFSSAFKNRTYRLIMAAFFTCGFHMALISNHFPSQLKSYGIAAEKAALAFSIYGAVTMAGSVLSGWLCGHFKMKNVQGAYFGSRVFVTVIFLLLPKNNASAFLWAAFLGLTGAATVPPVSGLINREFGAEKLATLYGFAFFVHQTGAFLGAWFAGICVERFGIYEPIWIADLILCASASLASFCIHEKRNL